MFVDLIDESLKNAYIAVSLGSRLKKRANRLKTVIASSCEAIPKHSCQQSSGGTLSEGANAGIPVRGRLQQLKGVR